MCCLPEAANAKLYTVSVRRTGPGEDSWEIVHPPASFHSVELGERDRLLDPDGTWIKRPYPSALLAVQIRASERRYLLDRALELARTAALNLVIDGRTIAEIAAALRCSEPDDDQD